MTERITGHLALGANSWYPGPRKACEELNSSSHWSLSKGPNVRLKLRLPRLGRAASTVKLGSVHILKIFGNLEAKGRWLDQWSNQKRALAHESAVMEETIRESEVTGLAIARMGILMLIERIQEVVHADILHA